MAQAFNPSSGGRGSKDQTNLLPLTQEGKKTTGLGTVRNGSKRYCGARNGGGHSLRWAGNTEERRASALVDISGSFTEPRPISHHYPQPQVPGTSAFYAVLPSAL